MYVHSVHLYMQYAQTFVWVTFFCICFPFKFWGRAYLVLICVHLILQHLIKILLPHRRCCRAFYPKKIMTHFFACKKEWKNIKKYEEKHKIKINHVPKKREYNEKTINDNVVCMPVVQWAHFLHSRNMQFQLTGIKLLMSVKEIINFIQPTVISHHVTI